ncbi:hypothetical protein JCM8097_006778 [Rhodosporidiobolus ruineniae]
MTARLLSSRAPLTGMRVGPPSDPTRYTLVKELRGPFDWRLNAEDAPVLWEAVEQSSRKPVAIKIIRENANDTWTSLETDIPRLWRVAGHVEVPAVYRGPLLPQDHPGQQRCIRILDSFPLPFSSGEEWVEVTDPVDGYVDIEDSAAVLELLGPSLAEWQGKRPSPADQLAQDEPAREPSIKLAGFSYSHWTDDSDLHTRHPPADWTTASPEQLLLNASYGGYGLPSASDVWAIGAVVSLLLFDSNLALNGFDPDVHYPRHDGPLSHWSTSSEVVLSLASLDPSGGWPNFFDEMSARLETLPPPLDVPGVEPMPTLRERVEAAAGADLDAVEREKLTSFLQMCWTLDPQKRAGTKELLTHEWLEGVE